MSAYLLNPDSEDDVDNPPEIEIKPSPGPSNVQTLQTITIQNNGGNNMNEAQDLLNSFWPKVTDELRNIKQMDLKNQPLPLARIKKIMKLDDNVKMISAEAPILFSKAAELFISELTLRAWIHTEDNKRRTLQRNDIAMAISKYDMFDFLIDIVPREEIKAVNAHKRDDTVRAGFNADQVQYYFQIQQQQQQNNVPTSTSQPTIMVNGNTGEQIQTVTVCPTTPTNDQNNTQNQVIQIQNTSSVNCSPTQNTSQVQAGTPQGVTQLIQHIISPNGDVSQIPIQISGTQLQMLRGNTNQPIILTSAPSQPHQLIQVAATSPDQN